jgi:DNA-binding transcriptional regulator YiaG
MMASKSIILNVLHDGGKDLHEAGLMDEMTMREFDAQALPDHL